jgi:transcriptional regulator with XRE-family HTH domain
MVALSDQRGERYHFAKRGGISFTALSEFESGAVLRFPSRALAVRHADRFTSPPEGYTVHAVKARTAFEVMIARYFETLRYLDQLAA